MDMKKKKPSPLTKAVLETARDLHEAGILDASAHEKIIMRHLGRSDSCQARRSRISPLARERR
jgi:hypothetical protein